MVWGEGAQAIPALIRKAINTNNGSTYSVFGSGRQYRDFIYIDDIVDALILAPRAYGLGVIQIGTGVGTSVRDLAYKVSAVVSNQIGIDTQPTFNLSAREGDRGRVAV
jgi:UDP-glucose 4-epimerase